MLAILRRLASDEGLAILISTHDSRTVEAADRVIALDTGSVA